MDQYPSSAYPSSSRQAQTQTFFDGPGARPILGAGISAGQGQPGPSSASSSTTTATAASSNLNPPQSQPPRATHHHHQGSADFRPPNAMSDQRGTVSPSQETTMIKRVGGKANVSSACGPCKRAHLACDVARPCKRCVNMGKEDQCEDVPHKKRGRPKVPKPALGEPYHRAKPPAQDIGGVGKWRGPSGYDAPYMTGVDAPPLGAMGSRASPPIGRPLGMGLESDPAFSAAPPPPNQPFTLFTTTDFKILRASPMSYHLIGYHPNEFVNLNLLDWIYPQDRHLVDLERNRLLMVPYVEGPLRSIEVTQAAITQRSELELLSPAEGMREPYPNKNVRVLHSDNRFSHFNVRLHLGGGLGASLWQPNTLGRVYLVVSFLAIPRSRDLPLETPAAPSRRSSQIVPPTPVTPIPPLTGGPGGLPGFSSIAAAADAPQQRYDQPSQPYYPPLPLPQAATSSRPPSSSQSAYPYPRATAPMMPGPGPGLASGAGPMPVQYGRRSSSPNSTYRTPQTSTYPIGAQDYPPTALLPPPPPQQGGYYAPPPPDQAYRRPSDDEQWRNAAVNGNGVGIGPGPGPGNGNGNGNGNGSAMNRGIPPSLPSGGIPNDGARRIWES
ncbi:hypothetical protein I316_00406 [Kwoniella heveanensis BCC8398]|uniref:Transcription activator of gluconeogenesis ERT1 n=1 Tax=Kwoniella heveanensis BCC8398 TaxID=1296120 RepID=A0A1B9H4I5_9TREE|nr:hypothetical protein I316_00406 [Kwoniella heveanensis BCC8398]